jgi:hypothetical protein
MSTADDTRQAAEQAYFRPAAPALTPEPKSTAALLRHLVDASVAMQVLHEDHDGEWRRWEALSPEGKLTYLAYRADVSDGRQFADFAAVAEQVLGAERLTEVALRTVVAQRRELAEVERAMPGPYELLPRPLWERVQDLVRELDAERAAASERPADRERDR